MSLKVAILAGGMATRLRPLSFNIPKSLIGVNNRPFIEWQLRLLAESGINSVVLCLGYRAQEIVEFVRDGSQFGVDVTYSIENSPLGTGGALRQAEPLLGDYFGVLYGDSYLPINYRQVFSAFESSSRLGLMTVYKNENNFDKSNVMINDKGDIRYSKRNFQSDMKYIDYGFSILRRQALLHFAKEINFDLSELFEELSLANQIECYEVHQRFYEVGSFNGIVELNSYLESETK